MAFDQGNRGCLLTNDIPNFTLVFIQIIVNSRRVCEALEKTIKVTVLAQVDYTGHFPG